MSNLRLVGNTIQVTGNEHQPIGTIRTGQWTRGGKHDPKSVGIDYAAAVTEDGRQSQFFETSPNADNHFSSNISAYDLALNFLREVAYARS